MSAEARQEPQSGPETVVGERSIASVNAARSLQSRVSNLLATGLICTLGMGLLGWYYVHTFARQTAVKRAAQTASRSQAAGEMPLPSLGKIDPPAPAIAAVLGPAPELPTSLSSSLDRPVAAGMAPGGIPAQPAPKPAWKLAMERRLSGPVSEGPQVKDDRPSTPPAADEGRASVSGAEEASSGESALATLLKPSGSCCRRARSSTARSRPPSTRPCRA